MAAIIRQRESRLGRRVGRLLLSLLFITPVVTTQLRPTASAYLWQCGTPGNYFDGMYRIGDNIEGVKANITSRFSGVCDTDSDPANNFTNAWSMITPSTSNAWVQSGYERGFGTGVRHFSQIYSPGLQDTTAWGSLFPYNEDHTYWQQYDPATKRIRSNVDLTNFLVTSFNPFAVWPQPFISEFMGEVRYLASDVPGYSGSAAGFWSIQTQRTSNHSWQFIPCPYLTGLNDQPSRWAVQGVSCTSFHIYTHTP